MFKLDQYYLLINKEKTLVNRIFNGDSEFTEGRLEFSTEYKDRRPTGFLIPTLVVTIWRKLESGCWISHGVGVHVAAGEPVRRRSVKILEKLAAGITDSQILNIVKNNAAALESDRIL